MLGYAGKIPAGCASDFPKSDNQIPSNDQKFARSHPPIFPKTPSAPVKEGMWVKAVKGTMDEVKENLDAKLEAVSAAVAADEEQNEQVVSETVSSSDATNVEATPVVATPVEATPPVEEQISAE